MLCTVPASCTPSGQGSNTLSLTWKKTPNQNRVQEQSSVILWYILQLLAALSFGNFLSQELHLECNQIVFFGLSSISLSWLLFESIYTFGQHPMWMSVSLGLCRKTPSFSLTCLITVVVCSEGWGKNSLLPLAFSRWFVTSVDSWHIMP